MPTTYAIPDGRTVMAATTYTGTSATNNLSNAVNGVSFKPDFVWMKNRTNALSHYLNDSVRGPYKTLFSNLTNAEYNGTADSDGVSTFNSNGFTLLNGTNAANYNQSANNYVAWQWQAGQGTTSSNTSGSITSTVSVNATAGFSIVTYTGTGANATVGHGLGVAPSMVIVKNRSTAQNWPTWHTSLGGGTNYLTLNTTTANSTDTTLWNSTVPTSSVFSVGTAPQTNQSTSTFVAYCWAAVPGYSAFGSYTGNGSTDGPFVYCGFRPRYVMVKMSSSTGDWYLFDTSRDPYNATQQGLLANTTQTDATYTGWGDILSNGFKIRRTDAAWNTSGGTYIYACFAENPFKYANAR